MAMKVQFQIGHSSKLRSKKTVEGFTHDWELYVKGVAQADISAFVEKIIFNLHESFQKPKRVCNKPPYIIQESGYAGFIVFIDIYFRNRDEPKKVQFIYDLDLQQTGPPQHRHDLQTFIFDNPSEEYRQKLLKGGGVPVSGVMGGMQPIINNNVGPIPSAVSLNHSPGDGHKVLLGEGKKHKLRPDDVRSNSFANLFGPPITKTSTVAPTAITKQSPDNKPPIAVAHAIHQSSTSAVLPAQKEKSTKDKEKSTEKSKERSEKKEKHHKQSLTSPHKEGRSESRKSDGSKHEKREKAEEKSKKDKNRDKDRERDRDKSSVANSNNSSSTNKRPTSPKPTTEHSPLKSIAAGNIQANAAVNNTNSIPRPLSSNSGKLEEIKTSSKTSKDSSGESKSKESKQKESSSSSSSKKSKKEKKDKDKERDKEKRHEEREKHKLAEGQQRSGTKEEASKINSNINAHANNINALDNKNSKTTTNLSNTNVTNDVSKKPEKSVKQDSFKTSGERTASNNSALAPPVPTANVTTHSSTEKKISSSSSLNSNSNPTEKDKRSHKHKKKEKNKDKDKERERDKERDKDKDKERDNKDKDKDKEKEVRKEKEKEAKDKLPEEKSSEALSSSQQNSKAPLTPVVNAIEEQPNPLNPSAPSTSITNAATFITTATAITSSSSSSSSTKSSKNKEKKSKDKSSTKEEKLKHKTNDVDTSESKAKQAKLSSSNPINNVSSLITSSSSSSSVSTSIANAITNPPNAPSQPVVTTAPNSAVETNINLNLVNNDSLPAAKMQQVPPLLKEPLIKPSLQVSPIITHSESSNSSFPEQPLPKQQPPPKPITSQERSKPITALAAVPPAPLPNSATKEHPKTIKSTTAKEKSIDKPLKEEEKEKKRRRNSQAVNTFIEPPLKQLKTKEQAKSIRDKSKSPSLRNTGSRSSISADTSNTFLQPSASPSSTAAAAPLPPPSSASSAALSPALSATEAVGNAASATANAATCNSNSGPSSTTNSTSMAAPHHLPLDYLSELQELHHKIMTLQDNEELQHVVELIAATGCYEITTKTFDFDLCKLDRGTVQRLQEFFATSVS